MNLGKKNTEIELKFYTQWCKLRVCAFLNRFMSQIRGQIGAVQKEKAKPDEDVEWQQRIGMTQFHLKWTL